MGLLKIKAIHYVSQKAKSKTQRRTALLIKMPEGTLVSQYLNFAFVFFVWKCIVIFDE